MKLVRHIVGVFLGIILAPVIPYAIGWGGVRLRDDFAENFALTGDGMLAIGVIVAAGVVVGAMASMRWLSPIAALIAGVAYLAVTVLFVVSPGSEQLRQLPIEVVGPVVQGFFGLLGGVLVMSALSPGRWRGKAKNVEPDPGYLQPPPMPRPAGPAPTWGPEPASSYGGQRSFTPPSGPPRPPEMPPDNTP